MNAATFEDFVDLDETGGGGSKSLKVYPNAFRAEMKALQIRNIR